MSALVAGVVATSVATLGSSPEQVSAAWARNPVQRVTCPQRA